MPKYEYPSKDEFEDKRGENSEFTPMPDDDYIVEVDSIAVSQKVNKFHPEEGEVDNWQVKFKLISFANGDELVDINGNDVSDRLMWGWIDPNRVGLEPQPSLARKFLSALLGISIEDRIELDDVNDLIGKRAIASCINKNGYLKPTSYRVVRTRRSKPAATDAEVAAKAAAKLEPKTDLVEAAKEVFANDLDDLPF